MQFEKIGLNLQHYRKYGIIELVAMVQQEYKETQEERMAMSLEKKESRSLTPTEQYAKEVQELMLKYAKILQHIETQEKLQMKKAEGNIPKQGEIIEKYDSSKKSLESWKNQECLRLQAELNQRLI